jgi:hypothetical protein
MTVTYGYDITADNWGGRPSYGQACLYMTGADGIAATTAMRAAVPGAVLIDQSPDITKVDVTADVFDCENAALTVAELPDVIRDAWDSWDAGGRPGQRKPAVYVDASGVTGVTNALSDARLSGTGLFIAHWGIGQAAAAAMVGTDVNRFPVVGVQYATAKAYDLDVLSTAWLTDVSRKATAKPAIPPGQWKDPGAWSWESAVISGIGLDGDRYSFTFNPVTGQWGKTPELCGISTRYSPALSSWG